LRNFFRLSTDHSLGRGFAGLPYVIKGGNVDEQ
jgi:hypothetical protein